MWQLETSAHKCKSCGRYYALSWWILGVLTMRVTPVTGRNIKCVKHWCRWQGTGADWHSAFVKENKSFLKGKYKSALNLANLLLLLIWVGGLQRKALSIMFTWETNLSGKRELITFSMLLARLTARPWSRSPATVFSLYDSQEKS